MLPTGSAGFGDGAADSFMILSLSSRILVPVNARQASSPRPVTASARSSRQRRTGQGTLRRSPTPRPGLVRVGLVAVGLGLGATTALTITAETSGPLTAAGGGATFAGNLTGMVGTYLALIMVLLVSRIPFVEHVVGQDGLLRWHRRLAPFVGHPLTQVVWSVWWAATAGLVLAYRFGLPVFRTLRHQLRVSEVRTEAPGVVSVICQGRHLDQLPVSGGQFLFWRFLTRDMWWQAHPYSLSALPQPPYVRLTVKGVGDHSAALARLQPGTRVAVEGPYGTFTRYAQRRRRVLLVAAGIGVTAVRSLLEDLPRGAKPVVILRAARREDLALREEIADLVQRRGGQLHELTGSRAEATVDEHLLPRIVSDLGDRDVYVCGPEAFVAGIVDVAAHLGVPREAIHHEAFAL